MDEVILTKEEGVGILRINRAEKMNAMTNEMWAEFRRLLIEARDDEEVKVLILTGTGHAFCAGADVEKRLASQLGGVQTAPTRNELLEPLGYTASIINAITKPVIGAINGTAAGGGFSLALLCDIRIVSEKARFAAAWVKIGFIPDWGATWLLPRIVGMDKALKIMYTGDIIDAEEALRLGIATIMVPHDEVLAESLELARRIAQGPTITLDFIKRGAKRGIHNTLDEQLDFETYAQNVCRTTEDHREGVRAFQEKRQPVFRGR